jgi:hypothetical protein
LAVHHQRPSRQSRLFDEATLQVPNMSFGQILVFADEENDVIPKIH